jgi:transposase, IS30 family
MPSGYHHVTRDIRSQIYALKATGTSLQKIADVVGRHVSTISREINRNTGGRGYRYKQADEKATERRENASRTPLKLTSTLVATIEENLLKEWSPDQISGRLKENGIASISHETIYQHIWKNKRAGGTLYKHLRRSGKKYNKRSSGKAGRGCIPNRVDITARPPIVEQKTRIGDWEGDTVISAVSKTAILTVVDRHSKFTRIKKLGRKTAENVRIAMKEVMTTLPYPVFTVTYDNGMEFAAHQDIAADLKAHCFFATPYHSWERGLNEHTNGLIRQYLPKSVDFKDVTDAEIQAIEDRLNNRPRKILGYKTPMEVMMQHLNLHTSPPVTLDG